MNCWEIQELMIERDMDRIRAGWAKEHEENEARMAAVHKQPEFVEEEDDEEEKAQAELEEIKESQKDNTVPPPNIRTSY